MAEAPTNAGVLGMTRMTRAPESSPLSNLAMGTPAEVQSHPEVIRAYIGGDA